ncbi:DUF1338 domain-containing protein [Halomonas organivorans]|uniref:2-oxoadipate dioxygenase/decarboxylase n=1 Tax=Halomonas organivorans TaxID=257772 RepID=A0A7W5BXD2_9GAMM|nr:DUF1338 domain-containing protein [Halomonas organivorans]MBB3140760.1 hypothetical protein [Halomonas organivorans]
MQREEFVQQLWLDYVHQHPELGGLRLWPRELSPEYLALLTLNHGPWAMEALLPPLVRFGYRPVQRYAMADRGLLATLLAAPDDGAWLVLAELQLGTLSRGPRESLQQLVSKASPADCRGQNLLCRGRPWPMPTWTTYQTLAAAHPLAGWLAAMGPRLHHPGFDCSRIGQDIAHLDGALTESGMAGNADRHHGILPISPLLDYRFFPSLPRRLVFADGDEHRLTFGGLALVQKQVSANQERAVELLLPHHTRCELT